MSTSNSPRKGSPSKHKGMMTSLYNNNESQQHLQQQQNQYVQRIDNNKTYTTTSNNPNGRIFVQTISSADQPNVLPYINSGYSTQPQVIGQAQSQYVIMNERQNHLMAKTTTMRPQQIISQNNVRVSPVIGGEQNLSRTKFVESSAHYQSRVPNGNASTYVPPPPESFLIPNSATKVVQNRSLNKTVIQSVPVPTIIPTQNIKKTFIPHHIINEIPIYTGTVYTAESGYRSSSQQRNQQQHYNQQQSQSNDESQQVLMGYYEKLYAKYQQQKQRSLGINQQLSQAVNEIGYLKSQLQIMERQYQQQLSTIHTNVIPPPPIPQVVVKQTKKVIDKRRLHDLLMSKCSVLIDNILQRKKQSCLRQISNVVETRRVTIKVPSSVSGEVHHHQQQQSGFVYYPR